MSRISNEARTGDVVIKKGVWWVPLKEPTNDPFNLRVVDKLGGLRTLTPEELHDLRVEYLHGVTTEARKSLGEYKIDYVAIMLGIGAAIAIISFYLILNDNYWGR